MRSIPHFSLDLLLYTPFSQATYGTSKKLQKVETPYPTLAYLHVVTHFTASWELRPPLSTHAGYPVLMQYGLHVIIEMCMQGSALLYTRSRPARLEPGAHTACAGVRHRRPWCTHSGGAALNLKNPITWCLCFGCSGDRRATWSPSFQPSQPARTTALLSGNNGPGHLDCTGRSQQPPRCSTAGSPVNRRAQAPAEHR